MQDRRTLRIADICKTLQGEMPGQGKPVCIVRLSGCSAGCPYCDTKKSWTEKGREMSVKEILSEVGKSRLRNILVTGGEPLEQKSSKALLAGLIKSGFEVTVETNGRHPLTGLPGGLKVAMDIKIPSKGFKPVNKLSNLKKLKRGDILKFVIGNEKEYRWANRFLARYGKDIKCEVVFSPVYDKISARKLAGLLLKDNSKYGMQIQLHKYLNLP